MTRRAPVAPAPVAVPRVGLLVNSPAVDEPDDRWAGGLITEPEGCAAGGIYDPCNVQAGDLDLERGRGTLEAEPFVLWAGDVCSTFGYSERDWTGRANRLLAACQSKQIERELWRGDQARSSGWPNRFLAHPDADVLTAGAVEAIVALALLEDGLADCSCSAVGVIHATRGLVTHWANGGALRWDRGKVYTINGTEVVPGAGYDGSGPGVMDGDEPGEPVAAASGSVWAYATGPVRVRLGPARTLPSSLDEARQLAASTKVATNDIEVRAERDAVATWEDCCHLAVQTEIERPALGGS